MKRHIIGVLGLGIFGRTVATQLTKAGREVIAVDYDSQHVNIIADEVTTAAIGDFTDFELLKNIGLDNCDTVVIATGTNLESSVLAVMHCKRLGIEHIIAKAHSTTFEQVLTELGATLIISPERDSGIRLTKRLLRTHIEEVLHLDDTTSLVEFVVPSKWIGRSILDLDLRKNYDMNIIGYRPKKGEKIINQLNITQPIQENTVFVAIVDSDTFEQKDYLGKIN